MEALQRLQWLILPTSLFRGLPRVLPINEGILPLGFPLFIFALRLSQAPYQRLQYILKCIQDGLELLGRAVFAVFAEPLVYLMVHHHHGGDEIGSAAES